jgi:hypothetical protein
MCAAAPPSGAASFSYLVVFSNCSLIAAVLTFAIAQSIKVLTTWYALSPLSISTRCPDLISLPDGICICPPLIRARDRRAGIRRTGGTRRSWWAPAGYRPRTRPPSQRSLSPLACRRGSPARCSPPPPSSPPWLVSLPAPPLPFDTKKRGDHLWQAVDLIGSLIILGRVVVIWGRQMSVLCTSKLLLDELLP